MGEPVYSAQDLRDLQALLQGLNLLGQKISQGNDTGGNDQGAVALESVVTRAGKIAGGAVAALGGLSAVGTAIAAFWKGSNDSIRVPVIWSLSIVTASAGIALAVIVGADLLARSRGHAAVYDARRGITAKFLELLSAAPAGTATSQAASPPAVAASNGNVSAGGTAATSTADAALKDLTQGLRDIEAAIRAGNLHTSKAAGI